MGNECWSRDEYAARMGRCEWSVCRLINSFAIIHNLKRLWSIKSEKTMMTTTTMLMAVARFVPSKSKWLTKRKLVNWLESKIFKCHPIRSCWFQRTESPNAPANTAHTHTHTKITQHLKRLLSARSPHDFKCDEKKNNNNTKKMRIFMLENFVIWARLLLPSFFSRGEIIK